MANAVFTTKVNPVYDDLPEVRYHFPKTYLNQAQETVGDWIVYYEPRREGADLSGTAGRQCYFATARVERVEPDPNRSEHFYAYVSNYLEFTTTVPFREGTSYYESGLRKDDGSTNKGRFGRALRLVPRDDYRLICQIGFANSQPVARVEQALVLAEEPVEYGRTNRVQLLERPFRDAAFTRVIQTAYQNTCAMTGLKLINGGGRCEIEAAHIQPVADNGPDSPRNGIALSRTVHWMFDRGILSVAETGEILLAKRLVPDQVRRMLNPDGMIRGRHPQPGHRIDFSSATTANISSKGTETATVTVTDSALQSPETSVLTFPGQFMLPNSQNPPSALTQLAIHKSIASLVPRQLLPPESLVRRRLSRVDGAAVPEAAIHKDGQPVLAEDKIGLSKHRLVPPPPRKAVAAQ